MERASAEIDSETPIDPQHVRNERMGYVHESRELLTNLIESKHFNDDQMAGEILKCAKALLYFLLGQNFYVACETNHCEKYLKASLALFDQVDPTTKLRFINTIQ